MSKTVFEVTRFKRRLALFSFIAVAISTLSIGIANSVKSQDNVNASANNNNLPSIMPSDMTPLSLQLVFTGSEVDTTVNSSQSLAITDKYFIVVQAHSEEENTGWLVATNLNNPSSTPTWTSKQRVGHAAGATWNSATNQIVVATGIASHPELIFYNANNGQYSSASNVSHEAVSIAYNDNDNQLIQMDSNKGYFLKANYEPASSFDTAVRLVQQDSAYYNGFNYRTTWGGCAFMRDHMAEHAQDYEYCLNNFGENSNVIYQFNMSGEYTNAFYIQSGFGEVESMAFGPDGTPYLLFNGKPTNTQYSVYKVTNAATLNKMKGRANQTVSFSSSSATKTYGDAKFTNKATTSGNGAITYSSSNTDVATVNSSTGEVTIKKAGTAKITASAARTNEYKAGSASYTLTVNKKSTTITFSNSASTITKTYGDSSFTNKATASRDGTVSYVSSDTDVATVSSAGAVTIKGVGTTKITASIAVNDNYTAGSASYAITVNKKKSAKPVESETTKTGYYTDKLSTVKFTTKGLTWKDDKETIKLGQNNYKVNYTENNDTTNYTTESFDVIVEGVRRQYEVESGDGQVHIIDSNSEYTRFVFNADYELFEEEGEVWINGVKLNPENYTSHAGSTVIEIRNSYLDTLSPGTYSINIYFNDGGEAKANFAIKEKIIPEASGSESESGSTSGGNSGNSGSSGSNGNSGNSGNSGSMAASSPNTGEVTGNENGEKPAVFCLPILVILVVVFTSVFIRIKNRNRINKF